MLCMHIPTTFIENNVLQEYHVYMNRKTDQYWVHFRGIELDSSFLGLGKYSEFDQMFVNSITRICDAFIICQGRYVNLPRGRSDSKNLVKTVIAKMGPDGNVANVREVTVSKNCQKVLPLTCELTNRTCQNCVHDINQRIRQLASGGFIERSEAAEMLKRTKMDVFEDFGIYLQHNTSGASTSTHDSQDKSKGQDVGSDSSDEEEKTNEDIEASEDESSPTEIPGGATRNNVVSIFTFFIGWVNVFY